MTQDTIESLLWDFSDPITFQSHDLSKSEVFEHLTQEIRQGKIIPMLMDGILFLFVPENKFVLRMHLISKSKTPISTIKRMTETVFQQTTFRKIYGFASDQRFIRAVERFGGGLWKFEGTVEGMFYDQAGGAHPVFIFGATKK